MTIKDINRDMVELALAEFDQLGRDAMLDKYSSGPRGKSIRWYIQFNARYYDQKLILRAAHELGGLGSLPLGRETFGARQAKSRLRKLGFTVDEI